METMETPKKRKGTRSSSPSLVGSRRKRLCDDDGNDLVAESRKKCKEETISDPEKAGSCGKKRERTSGTVMTAPPCGGLASEQPGRGHKRKLSCVEPATQVGRKKKLENEYVLGSPIGHGKFGSVRLCWSKGNGDEFACKTLPKKGEQTVQMEVEIMQHLSGHPGVVTLKAVFEDSECFHLVMEMCSGGRLLDQMVKEGTYSEHRAARLIKDLVSVIKYCHDMGVVHRDIKPENILLTPSGEMKLADFGLAMRVTNGQKLTGLAGSPAYVAPEVLSGHYSQKVDIWGAGVLLHALLVGALPFRGESHEVIFEAIKTVELNFHSGIWESISGLARDLIGRMLTRDVSSRMTADEILTHPWILFYTESPSKAIPTKSKARTGDIVDGTQLKFMAPNCAGSLSSSGSSTRKSEELDDAGFVDALTAAVNRVRISEPKRTRLCGPASPIEQECSSNLKANLLAAF